MRLISDDLLNVFKEQTKRAKEADIAVAFFSPSEEQLSCLKKVSNLRLLISDDFKISNPYKLESLKKRAKLRCINPIYGRLHAKIYIFRRQNERSLCIIGSANLSRQGFGSNREVCILLDSNSTNDKKIIKNIEDWFESNFSDGDEIDFTRAKKEYKGRPRVRTPITDLISETERNYWILKTTEGSNGKEMWKHFVDEGVIAIGWKDFRINTNKIPSWDKIVHTFRNEYGYKKREAQAAATTITNFIEIGFNDIVIICHGYTYNQKSDVFLYGVANVTGPFYQDRTSNWWISKHKADIQRMEEDIPINWLKKAFERKTLLRTLHYSNKEQYNSLRLVLKDELGIILEF